MLSKCANPVCTTPFHYLHDGRLFQMETGANAAEQPEHKKGARRIEYFWLCNRCAAEMTLRYERGVGVITVPIQQVQRAAAS
jgi:hypothetical protein